MLIYDALDGRFLAIKLRSKQPNCSVCGDNPSINKLLDYELFCGASATDKVRSQHVNQSRHSIPLAIEDTGFYSRGFEIWTAKETPLGVQGYLFPLDLLQCGMYIS